MLQQNYFFANKVLFYLKHMENVWIVPQTEIILHNKEF